MSEPLITSSDLHKLIGTITYTSTCGQRVSSSAREAQKAKRRLLPDRHIVGLQGCSLNPRSVDHDGVALSRLVSVDRPHVHLFSWQLDVSPNWTSTPSSASRSPRALLDRQLFGTVVGQPRKMQSSAHASTKRPLVSASRRPTSPARPTRQQMPAAGSGFYQRKCPARLQDRLGPVTGLGPQVQLSDYLAVETRQQISSHLGRFTASCKFFGFNRRRQLRADDACAGVACYHRCNGLQFRTDSRLALLYRGLVRDSSRRIPRLPVTTAAILLQIHRTLDLRDQDLSLLWGLILLA